MTTPGLRVTLRTFGPAIALIAFQQVVFPVGAGVLLQGLVLGLLSAMVAVGLALIYRTNRIINFAQAELGALPASFAVLLVLYSGPPHPHGRHPRGLPTAAGGCRCPSAGVLISLPAVVFPLLQRIGPELTRDAMIEVLSDVAPLNADYLTTYQISFGEQGIFDSFDMSAFDDTTEIWWDTETVGPDELGQEAAGMYQYVDGGVRYLPDEWPDTEPNVFDADAAVAIYDTPPPGEEATCHQPGGPEGV